MSGMVALSLTERERARLSGLARNLGFARLDPLAAELMRIGLATMEARYSPVTRHEALATARMWSRATRHGPLEGVE